MTGPQSVGLQMGEPFRVEVAAAPQGITAIAYAAARSNLSGVTLILGHGAGAGQTSGFIVEFATALSARGIDIVTFNFLYTEQGRRIPDPNPRLENCYRAVIEAVRERKPGKLAIGGKSMGGRIASQVAAGGAGELAGLVFLGYPLHPPGRPDRPRTVHLRDVRAPMLFVQGARDAFGTPAELQSVIAQLDAPTELYVVEGGDHSFKVPKSAGVRQQEVHRAIQARIDAWLRAASAS
jgi:predicted alpha/beta-hydrolase family hydrolase